MNRSEEVFHLRSAFRQGAGIELVLQIRSIALEYLPPLVVAKVPPPYFPERVRKAYEAKGVSLEWNLDITGDTGVDVFCFVAARDAGLTPSQQSAAKLLGYCTEALETNTLSERVRQNILDAYAGLDFDAITTGQKFKQGRKTNTGGPIRKFIAGKLKNNPELKNPALWDAVKTKSPRGWTAYENRVGKYLEGPGEGQTMTQGRFFTVCGEERKKIMR